MELQNLLQRNLPALHAFVRLQMGEALSAKESSSDVVQSVCCEVLQEIDSLEYRGERAFRNLLFTMALRKLIDRRRYYAREKRDVQRELSAAQEPSDGEARGLIECYGTFCTPSAELAARDEVARIEAAFSQLDDHHREAIVLCRIAGLSYEEAAAEIGRTRDSVRGMVARGLAKLGRLLAQSEGPG